MSLKSARLIKNLFENAEEYALEMLHELSEVISDLDRRLEKVTLNPTDEEFC